MKKIKAIIKFIDKKIDLKKFFKFGVTGVINTAIDWGLFTLCVKVLTLPAVIAYIIGYTVSTVFSFFVNKNWTFGKRKNYNKAETFRFIAVNLTSLSLSTFGVYLLHNIAGNDEFIAKLIMAVPTILINYFGNKLFVFK